MSDSLEPRLHDAIIENVAAAIAEDVGSGDITAELIEPEKQAAGRVITREHGVMCGIPWAERTREVVDHELHIDWQVSDGETLTANQTLFTIGGPRALHSDC